MNPAPITLVCPFNLAIPPRSSANNLITFATPFIRRPNVISRIGPSPATAATIIAITFFVLSPRPLNFSSSPEKNLTTGVKASRNAFPNGIISFLMFSNAAWNLTPVESSIFFISLSDRIANSSTDAPANLNALDA